MKDKTKSWIQTQLYDLVAYTSASDVYKKIEEIIEELEKMEQEL